MRLSGKSNFVQWFLIFVNIFKLFGQKEIYSISKNKYVDIMDENEEGLKMLVECF